MTRSYRELKLDTIIGQITTEAQQKAAEAAFEVDAHDQVLSPTSIRLNRRTLTYFDTLASNMSVSRNSIIQAVLEHLVSQAEPSPRASE